MLFTQPSRPATRRASPEAGSTGRGSRRFTCVESASAFPQPELPGAVAPSPTRRKRAQTFWPLTLPPGDTADMDMSAEDFMEMFSSMMGEMLGGMSIKARRGGPSEFRRPHVSAPRAPPHPLTPEPRASHRRCWPAWRRRTSPRCPRSLSRRSSSLREPSPRRGTCLLPTDRPGPSARGRRGPDTCPRSHGALSLTPCPRLRLRGRRECASQTTLISRLPSRRCSKRHPISRPSAPSSPPSAARASSPDSLSC